MANPGMRPIEATEEAFALLRDFDDDRVERSLLFIAEQVRAIAPGCVALSLSLLDSELTFTLAAEGSLAATLDAVQYLDGGPCVEALHRTEPLATEAGSAPSLDEERWQMFSRASAHLGVASTLSLPILDEGSVVAGANLYAEAPDTFDGHHAALGQACGAWADDAVTNADLSFQTRVRAAVTPDRLLEQKDVDLASGILAAAYGLRVREAASRLASAAARAGVSDTEFARFLLQAHLTNIAGEPSGHEAS